MATTAEKKLSGYKWAGISVMAGCVIMLISMLLLPGGVLIEPAEGGWDFAEATDILLDYPTLSDVVTFTSSLSVIALIGGLAVLMRRRSEGGAANGAVRVGAVLMLIGYALFLLYQGLRHMMIQVLEHEIGGVTPAEETAIAYSMHAVSMGAYVAFLTLASVSSILLGWGVGARFPAMNAYRIASILMVVVGVATLLTVLTTIYVPGGGADTLDPVFSALALIASGVQFVALIWWFLVGYGISKGMPEFVGEDAA